MTGDWEQIISSKQRRRVDVSHDSSTVTAIQQDTWMDEKDLYVEKGNRGSIS